MLGAVFHFQPSGIRIGDAHDTRRRTEYYRRDLHTFGPKLEALGARHRWTHKNGRQPISAASNPTRNFANFPLSATYSLPSTTTNLESLILSAPFSIADESEKCSIARCRKDGKHPPNGLAPPPVPDTQQLITHNWQSLAGQFFK